MKKRLLGVVAGAATAVMLLASCSGGGSAAPEGGDSNASSTPSTGGTVHMLQNSDFSYLDPARGFDGGVNAFYRLVYRGLTAQAPGDASDPNAIMPDLAESLGEASEDGLTWTYTLKDGLKFDNGDAITSAEVEFGIARAWDPEIGIGSPWLKQTIDAPADYEGPYRNGDHPGIETPDEKTLVFHLKTPFPEFDNVLAQSNAVPFPVGSGAGEEFIKGMIASGPYTLDSYTPGSVIKLKRNDHWDPKTDELRKAYPDAWQFNMGIEGATIDERMIAGQGGDVNAIAGVVQAATLPRLQDPKMADRVVTSPAFCTTYMSMNMTKEPFDKLEVRQAVNWALDRSAIVNATGGTMLADPATTIIPPAVSGHTEFDLFPSEGNAGNIEEAKKLLDEAGLADGFSFTLDMRAQPKVQAQSEAIQESLAKVGIDVKLNVIDTATYYETIGTPSQQNDAAITGWCPDWASSASTFLPPLFDGRRIVEKGNANLAQINDPALNERMDEISAMTDLEEANRQWGALDKEITSLSPIAPLAFEKGVFLPGDNIGGYFPSTSMTDLAIIGLKDPARG